MSYLSLLLTSLQVSDNVQQNALNSAQKALFTIRGHLQVDIFDEDTRMF